MSSESKPITNILIFLITFILARYITDSFGFIATEGWTGLYNLLVGYPIYLIVFISIMAFLFFLFQNILNYVFYQEDNNVNNRQNKVHPDTKTTKSKKMEVYKNGTISRIPQRNNKTHKIFSKKNTFNYIGSIDRGTNKNRKPTISNIIQNTDVMKKT